MIDVVQLRRAYGEICRGYSEATWLGQEVFVAHFTVFDQTEVELWQKQALDKAVKKGVPTEAERLKWLDDKGMWTRKEKTALENQQMYVDNLGKSHAKAALKIQRDQLTEQIREGREELAKMEGTKRRLIGITAEIAAEQQVQFEYIKLGFYRDRELTSPLLSAKELNNLSDEETDDLLTVYVNVISRLSLDTVRRISVQPFFANQFYLCGEDVRSFFGVPIVDLTLYQANLLSYGQYYRNVFSHERVDKDIMNDPDKIDEFIQRATNTKTMMAKASKPNEGFVGIVGATKEDFAAMGAEDGTAKMNEAAGKQFKDGKDVAKDLGFVYTDKR